MSSSWPCPRPVRAQASFAAEKLRGLKIAGVETRRYRTGPVTLSVGAAQLRENDPPFDVIERADQDLYASRRGEHLSKMVDLSPAEEEVRSAVSR